MSIKLVAGAFAVIFSTSLPLNAAQSAGGAAADAGGRPKAVINEYTHDFGTVKAGTELKHSFKISNAGSADLLISNVAPSCGCTASDFDKVVAPGETGKITLSIANTQHYAGELAKSAAVYTNDPARATFSLMLRAHFIAERQPGQPAKPIEYTAIGKRSGPFNISPTDRWVTGIVTGTVTRSVMYLVNTEASPVRIKDLSAGGSNFNVALNTIEDGKRYELTVATTEGLKPGKYEQTVRIVTDSKASREVLIPLEATVFPRVFATPNSVNLGKLSASSDEQTFPLIYVRKLKGKDLAVKGARSTLSFLKPAVSQPDEAGVYTVRVEMDRSSINGTGRFSGKILIETNDADAPILEVSVHGSFE